MNKKKIAKKVAIIILSLLLALSILLFAICAIGFRLFWGESFIAPGYGKIDRYLNNHFDELSYVANELFEMDYDSITIRKASLYEYDTYHMTVSREDLKDDTIPVPDHLIAHIDALVESGIDVIECSGHGSNYIDFSLWSSMDESRGIIYSSTEPNGALLIKVKQLSKDNWYYYVDNYEKAKAQYPERFQ